MVLSGGDGLTRAFVCVVPERGAAEALASFMEGLRRFGGYKWVSADGIHVTLKFLGDVTAEQIQKLDTSLSRLGGTRPFGVSASGIGFFPSPRRPKVIWLGVREGVPNLEKLARFVENAAKTAGIPEEKKKFRTHLTLARARDERDIPAELAGELERTPGLSWTCRAFVLMKSVLTPSGPIYTPIREYPLD
ncbi:MAG: RNA 2',3'-cyclic phosphodiesterase [Synergistaceae bacterium]|nr:RNA 2',3'-cyclic phosphodiesterase [Synergistaceae bacterium]